jgi:predicted RNA-binding Zn ribbon-like protein
MRGLPAVRSADGTRGAIGLEPGGRPPAPKPLDLVQRFVNSYDHLTSRGIIESPEALDRWIRGRGLPPGRPATRGDVRRMQAFREALRTVLEANNGGHLDAALAEQLNETCLEIPLTFRLGADGEPSILSAKDGPSGVAANVLAAVAEAHHRGIWARLKACRECGWVFYDRSKNRSGSWCTMAVCGSRSKMRTYRDRRKALRSGP